MTLPGLMWIDLTLAHTQRCQNLAWFLYGCAEREQRCNIDACMAWWLQAFTAAAAMHRPPAAAGTAPRGPAPTW